MSDGGMEKIGPDEWAPSWNAPWQRARRVLEAIWQERQRQDAKWGKQRHPFDAWITVLTEEVGEAAERSLKGDRAGLRDELVQ